MIEKICWNDIESLMINNDVEKIKHRDYNHLDNLASLLRGINPCFAVYIDDEDKLIVSANTKFKLNEKTCTDYNNQCMLQYLKGLNHYLNEFSQKELINALKYDKRFKSLKHLKSLHKFNCELKKLCKILEEKYQESEDNNYENDSIFKDTLQPRTDSLLNDLKNDQQDLDNIFSNLKKIVATDFIQYINAVVKEFELVIENINCHLKQLKIENSESKNQDFKEAINTLIELLLKIIPIDLNFLLNFRTFFNCIKHEPYINAHIIKALKNEYDIVDEILINSNDLNKFIIKDFPLKQGAFHAEYRIFIHKNKQIIIKNLGISFTCCYICYNLFNDEQKKELAGTHGKFCEGQALIGLILHDEDEQKKMLKKLFPSLHPLKRVNSSKNNVDENEKIKKLKPGKEEVCNIIEDDMEIDGIDSKNQQLSSQEENTYTDDYFDTQLKTTIHESIIDLNQKQIQQNYREFSHNSSSYSTDQETYCVESTGDSDVGSNQPMC